MIVFLSMLVVLSLAQGQDYHYERPHIPFNLDSPQGQQQPTKYVVKTLGPNSRTYDLESHRSPAIYENHQSNLLVQQQQQIAYQTAPQQQGQIVYNQPQQQVQHQQQQQVQHQYVQEQHQQVQQQQVQHKQQYQQQLVYQTPQQQLQVAPQQQQQQQQQLHTTAYTNPLLLNVNYQQQTPAAVSPPAPAGPLQPISYYTQQQQQPVTYQVQPQPQIQLQSAAQYGPPPPQPPPQQQQQLQTQQPPQRLYFQNPQPYAVVTLPNGKQVQDGGHGSGVPPPNVQYQLIVSTGTQPEPPRLGDHVGQSQSSSLDGYKHKQAIPGDTREYQRFINNCDSNGQCQQSNLSPGQIEPGHQQILQKARSNTQARIEGCTKSEVVYIPPRAQQNEKGQLRPKSRRTFERTEQLFIRYPYN